MDNTEKLNEEFKFYRENQKSLVADYKGKFVVIKDKQIEGVYDSEMEAYEDSQQKYELGTFLIQLVGSGEESYSQTFYSRVTI